jgi:hypothetical protein
MTGIVSPETGGPPRAFLWIPPDCQRVRGVIVGQHNMQEEPILEHPVFRTALRELGFAAIWVSPPFDLVFDFEQGAGRHFDAMISELARNSGYNELASAPVVPIGHSAAASFPWNFAAWAPQRTLAVISISGQWPAPGDTGAPPPPDMANLDGIPGLVTIGEYEWADERAAVGLKQRATFPKIPLTMLGEAGGGHFEVSPEKVAYLALYLRKAAEFRLPAGAAAGSAVGLKPIDPTSTGWLADRWRGTEPARVPASPVAEYAEPEEAFWCFDEEHAVATEKFRLRERGKRIALLGYVQESAVLPQVAGTHQQVTIPFRPLADGITFKLNGAFLETVPPGRPERWTGLPAGTRIARPQSNAPVLIERICGPVEKLDGETFRLRFYRIGLNNQKRSAEIWFVATHPGDVQYKVAVQQAVLRFPLRNETGSAQKISFPEIPAQRRDVSSLKLTAVSNAGPVAKVDFYVREGPAVIANDTLTFTTLPPRATLPIRVTVVAWQYGRADEPKLQTAEPVERSFWIQA